MVCCKEFPVGQGVSLVPDSAPPGGAKPTVAVCLVCVNRLVTLWRDQLKASESVNVKSD